MAKASARMSSATAIFAPAAARSIRRSVSERRWVIYNGYAEASTIPPSWHGWMHHTVDTPPTDETYKPHAVAEAAPAEYDRHAGRAAAARLDAGRGPPPEGDRRLQGLEPR